MSTSSGHNPHAWLTPRPPLSLPSSELRGGATLERTIQLSEGTVVVLDPAAVPLQRLWCLYEITETVRAAWPSIGRQAGATHPSQRSRNSHTGANPRCRRRRRVARTL